MAIGEMKFEKANGRMFFKIGASIAVSAKNNGWANGDSNGTSTDLILAVRWVQPGNFFSFKFGSTDQLFIDCSL